MHTTLSLPNIDTKLWDNILPFVASFIVIGLIAFIFWPGYMSPDSLVQLNQGLTGNYSDHHPPMMSFFWKLFSYIFTGPQTFLIFHMTLLFISVCLLQTLAKPLWLKLVISFLPLVPNIAAYSGGGMEGRWVCVFVSSCGYDLGKIQYFWA